MNYPPTGTQLPVDSVTSLQQEQQQQQSLLPSNQRCQQSQQEQHISSFVHVSQSRICESAVPVACATHPTRTPAVVNNTTTNSKYKVSSALDPISQILHNVKTQDPGLIIKSIKNRAEKKYHNVKSGEQDKLRHKIFTAQRNGDKDLIKKQKKKNDNHASAVASRKKREYIVQLFQDQMQQTMMERNQLADAYSALLKEAEVSKLASDRYIKMLEAKLKLCSCSVQLNANITTSLSNVNISHQHQNINSSILTDNNSTHSFIADSGNSVRNAGELPSTKNSGVQLVDADMSEASHIIPENVTPLTSESNLYANDFGLYDNPSTPVDDFESLGSANNESLFKDVDFNSPDSFCPRRQTDFRPFLKSDDSKDDEIETALAA